ncbi:MAG: protein tyrosine phosphatase [Chthoniobacteraceae bacterium]
MHGPHKRSAKATKLLFICSRNKIRSLTAEKWMEGIPGYSVRSAGTQPGARIVVTQCHIGWADIIFVMEKSHLQRLRQKFPDALAGKEIITLHIPDEYEFMAEDLIDELKAKLSPHVNFPDDG